MEQISREFINIWARIVEWFDVFAANFHTTDLLLGGILAATAFLLGRLILALVFRKLKLKGLRISANLFMALLAVGVFLLFQQFNPFGYAKQVIGGALFIIGLFVLMRVSEAVFIKRRAAAGKKFDIPVIVRDIIGLIVIVVAALISMKVFLGFEITALIATGTVISAVIGLALQSTLSNIFAGVALQMEKPFDVGDWVTIAGYTGEVVEMSWRSTRIRNLEDNHIYLPNSSVSAAEIYNFSRPTRVSARLLEVGVNYGTPPNKVKNVLREAVNSCEGVLKRPPVTVRLIEYGDFAITYRIRFWLDDFPRYMQIEDDVMTSIWYYFKRNDIVIPFPIRNVSLKTIDPEKEEEARVKELKALAQFIDDIPILDPLTPKELLKLAEKVKLNAYAAGEALTRQGDEGDAFFIVKSGEVKVSVAEGRREVDIGRFGEGYFFGEMSLLTGERRAATITALVDTEVIVIDKAAFNEILHNKPSIAKAMSKVIEKRKQQIADKALDEDEVTEVVIEEDNEYSAEKILKRIKNFFELD
ncbi:MAG: mechanosensitive ion channel [bacterium]|nr:mechanosensitive ion channel [bacterium]